MLSDDMKRGIKIACVKKERTIAQAAGYAGVSPASIYRFVKGDSDIRLMHLDTFCRKGLGLSFEAVMKLGK